MMLSPIAALALALAPQAGPGYYASVDATSAQSLRTTLHAVIDDHTRIPYTSSALDTWDVLEAAQTDPANPARILDVYRNRSFPKQGGGNTLYQREHTWPKSYGFPNDANGSMPYVDCHLLMLSDGGYNQDRSNKPFGTCTPACTELVTDANGGVGGGSGVYPGQSNWTSGGFTSGTFEVNAFRRGDIARAMFYAAIRYEGGNHGLTGVAEPDLELTDNLGLVAASNTGQNESFGYMGRLSVLLEWHYADPVDAFEINRNNVVASFQGNRNPFVDHPEWVDCLFAGQCNAGPPGEVYCAPSAPNSTNQSAVIEAAGSRVLADNAFHLLARQLPTNQFGFFLASRTQGISINPGGSLGNLCLGGEIGRVVGGSIEFSDIFGFFEADVDLTSIAQPTGPVAAVVGETWNFQAWFRDFQFGLSTSNFTDAWTVTWQ